MKKVLFLIPIFFFGFIVNVSASTRAHEQILGAVYNDNTTRPYNTLNLVTEFADNTILARFLSAHYDDLSTYLKSLSSEIYGFSYNHNNIGDIGVFAKSDLIYFGSNSSTNDGLYEYCDLIGCSYMFLTYNFSELNDNSVSFYSGNLNYAYQYYVNYIFFDSEMHFLRSLRHRADNSNDDYWTDEGLTEGRISGNFLYYRHHLLDADKVEPKAHDFTSFLNIYLSYGSGTFKNNSSYDKFILQYVYNEDRFNVINTESGLNAFKKWMLRIFSRINDVVDLSNEYIILNSKYIKRPIIYENSVEVYFFDEFSGFSIDLPDNYSSINLNDYKNGIVFAPISNNTCSQSDYDFYFYKSLDRNNNIYYSALDINDEILYTYYFDIPNTYSLYNLSVLNGYDVTINNVKNNYYYFYKEFSSEDVYLYYNSNCFSKWQANTSGGTGTFNLNGTDHYASASVINDLKATRSSIYSNTSSSYNDVLLNNEKGSNSANSSSATLSSIISNSYNNLSGLYTTITASVSMIGSFLIGLPPEVYSVLIAGFSIGFIVLILKLFL